METDGLVIRKHKPEDKRQVFL
ncbi:hypothetical protein [Methylomonas sp. MO1]